MERICGTSLFEKLLCAIYHRPYQIESCAELTSLASLADYYCALPILSRTLDSALHVSPSFTNNSLAGGLKGNSCEVFATSAKLRNELLFRESLIFVINPWTSPHYEKLSDPKLKKIARCAYSDVGAKAAHAERKITVRRLGEALSGQRHVQKTYSSVAMNNIPFSEIDETYLPSIYRDLSEFDSKEEDYVFILFCENCLRTYWS
jgi:hypothetical protein